MARRIIWTERAENIFVEILEFYNQRNQSKTYSKKLNSEIKNIIDLLIKHPFLGRKTDKENVRVLIKNEYKIFYLIKKEEIIILLVWDTRQSPENFIL